MKAFAAVAAGGALGAMARYGVNLASVHLLGTNFPYGTLIVNVVGSFIMGLLIEAMAVSWAVSTEMRLFLVVGILGAFTTFSTFSLDFAVLYRRGEWGLGLAYVLISVSLSIAAVFAGLALARAVLS